MKYLLILMAALAFSGYSQAAQTLPQLDAVIDLPIKGMKAVEVNGQIIFMSENGRYTFQGQVTDIWHKKPLVTKSDIEYSSTHINVDQMGMPIDDLNTITVGTGAKRVIVFIDPQCSNCKKLVQEILERQNQYTYKLIVVPALGEDSNKQARALFCAKDKKDALKRYMKGKLGSMKQVKDCNTRFYDLTNMLAHQIDVRGVPYVIAPDGRYRAGGHKLWSWLENK